MGVIAEKFRCRANFRIDKTASKKKESVDIFKTNVSNREINQNWVADGCNCVDLTDRLQDTEKKVIAPQRLARHISGLPAYKSWRRLMIITPFFPFSPYVLSSSLSTTISTEAI